MAEKKTIKAYFINSTYFELILLDYNLDKGKMTREPVNIPPKNEKAKTLAFISIEDGEGTKGSVRYKIGSSDKIVIIEWNITEPKIAGNEFKSSTDSQEFAIKDDGNAYLSKSNCTLTYNFGVIQDRYSIQVGWFLFFLPVYHSYVGIKDNKENKIVAWFDLYLAHSWPCYNKFPIFSDYGCFSLAKLIVCGNADDSRTVFNKKMGGYYGNGDSCGIIYGLNGVCHQMANRVIFACYNDSPVLDIPFSKFTYLVYGIYGGYSGGNSWVTWQFPYPFLENIQAVNKKVIELKILSLEKKTSPYGILAGKALKFRMENPGTIEVINNDLVLLLRNSFGEKFDKSKIHDLLFVQNEFLKQKEELVKSLLDKKMPIKKYMETLNNSFNDMLLKEFKNIMSEDEYNGFFKKELLFKKFKLLKQVGMVPENLLNI